MTPTFRPIQWLYGPGSRDPHPEQVRAVERDLAAMPWEAGYHLLAHGRGVCVCAANTNVTMHPAYVALRGKPMGPPGSPPYDTASGIGWPYPVVAVDHAYPMTAHGIAHGGSSVLLHECGHTLDRVLGGLAADSRFDANLALADRSDWLSCHRSQDWSFAPMYRDSPREAFAESFALWCMVAAGTFADRLAARNYGPIRTYWGQVARKLTWNSVRLHWR